MCSPELFALNVVCSPHVTVPTPPQRQKLSTQGQVPRHGTPPQSTRPQFHWVLCPTQEPPSQSWLPVFGLLRGQWSCCLHWLSLSWCHSRFSQTLLLASPRPMKCSGWCRKEVWRQLRGGFTSSANPHHTTCMGLKDNQNDCFTYTPLMFCRITLRPLLFLHYFTACIYSEFGVSLSMIIFMMMSTSLRLWSGYPSSSGPIQQLFMFQYCYTQF